VASWIAGGAFLVLSAVAVGFDHHFTAQKYGTTRIGGPAGFVIGTLLLWPLTVPLYLTYRYQQRKFGQTEGRPGPGPNPDDLPPGTTPDEEPTGPTEGEIVDEWERRKRAR
jgi:hypothetical protein